MNKIKLIFFGTPDFAVPSLQKLYDNFNVIAVVTAVDKAAGRGHELNISAVKKWALDHQLKVLQPKNLKSLNFQNKLKSLEAELFVVVAFRMMPKEIWSMPKYGTINLHASLLPDYRGAAPIQASIINGESITGLTCFFLKQEIDTGDIIMQKSIAILEDDTGGSLHDKMMIEGAELLVQSVNRIFEKDFKPIPQTQKSSKIAYKIFPEDSFINWKDSAEKINLLIRAMNPYPASKTKHEGIIYKIFKANPMIQSHHYELGSWIINHPKSELLIACSNGFLSIEEIQASSKRRMSIKDFLNGLKNK